MSMAMSIAIPARCIASLLQVMPLHSFRLPQQFAGTQEHNVMTPAKSKIPGH